MGLSHTDRSGGSEDEHRWQKLMSPSTRGQEQWWNLKGDQGGKAEQKCSQNKQVNTDQ